MRHVQPHEVQKLLEKTEGYASAATITALVGLAQRVPKDQMIVELGCYKGQGTVALGLLSEADILCVDHFQGQPYSQDAGAMQWDHLMGDYEGDFLKAVLDAKLDHRVTPMRMDTALAGHRYVGPPVGLLFIDGDHTYPQPLDDFKAWEPHLTPEALVVFDDSTFPGPGQTILLLEAGGVWRVFERYDNDRLSILRRKDLGKAT